MKPIQIISLTALLFIWISFTSCDRKDYKFVKGSVLNDSLNESRVLIQKQFDRDIIKSVSQVIDKEALIGLWQDSILLMQEDGKWYGMKPVDKKIELRLYESNKYKWEEKHTYSKLDTIKFGQYWTTNRNDSSFLELIYNMKSDTIFNHGDNAFVKCFLIDYFDDDTLWVRSFDVLKHIADDEARLFIRKTNANNK